MVSAIKINSLQLGEERSGGFMCGGGSRDTAEDGQDDDYATNTAA